ncbi:MAG: GNAT family N-acetyltransferase [Planctomycetaceae bacterium]|nr:GNAT family N-acetyltransferase [Planctomycetaceae bacterium]
MLSIRPFRNSDPPKLLEVWQQFFSKESQKAVPISSPVLSENVLGMPFFDNHGLFLAFDNDLPVGFAHASFGPNQSKSDLDPETGVIHLVMTVPAYPDQMELNRRLLEHCEKYLKNNGAKVIFGGSARSSVSFYTGLYGGCEPIGVYESDKPLIAAYQEFGYQTLYNTLRFTNDLRHFQVPFTPKSVVWRKKLIVNYYDTPPTENWFQACTTIRSNWFNATATLGPHGEKRAEVHIRTTQQLDLPSVDGRIPSTAALVHLQVADGFLRQGIGTFLLGEVIRRLTIECHPSRIETIVMKEEEHLVQFFHKLGWQEGEQGRVFLKILQDRRKTERASQ